MHKRAFLDEFVQVEEDAKSQKLDHRNHANFTH